MEIIKNAFFRENDEKRESFLLGHKGSHMFFELSLVMYGFYLIFIITHRTSIKLVFDFPITDRVNKL